MNRFHQKVTIDYTNWRKERRMREIIPTSIAYAETNHHPGMQWLLFAIDVEDGKTKQFAMKDIHSWTP